MYTLADYDYILPEHLIAHAPVEPADSARLLVLGNNNSSENNSIEIHSNWVNQVAENHCFNNRYVSDLPNLLPANTAIFLNNTRVVQARVPLHSVRVITKQGREVTLEYAEIFFLQKKDDYTCEALITLLKRNRPGTVIYITEGITATITQLTDKWVILQLSWITVDEFLHTYGKMPLPPYIPTTPETEEKYQTVFAAHNGSVAAPTASLHLTSNLLKTLADRWILQEYVTLHVGLWTFKPVDTSDIRDYQIHEETIVLEKKVFQTIAEYIQQGKNIMAIWTTVARTLETLPYVWKYIQVHSLPDFLESFSADTQEIWNNLTRDISLSQAEKYISYLADIDADHIEIYTKIFIYPWFQRRVVDMLMTNFHLPSSTLLMLVASFVGYEKMQEIYKYAIQQRYRFYSFGDAMLLQRKIS